MRLSSGIAGASLFANELFASSTSAQQREVPESIRKLNRMTAGVVPISDDERKARIAKAQRLMAQNKIEAIYLEPGPSMFYFTVCAGAQVSECLLW